MTERLRELNFEELKKLYAGRMQNDFPFSEIKPLELLEKQYKRGQCKAYELILGGEPKAYAVFQIPDEGDAWLLDYLAVISSERGKGYGSKMLSAIKTDLPAGAVMLEIERTDLAANGEELETRTRRKAFYIKNGVTETGVTTVADGGIGYEILCIEKGEKKDSAHYANAMLKIYETLFKKGEYSVKIANSAVQTAEVVAALVKNGDKFLICQRPKNKARGLLWEFVGGKVENGETEAEALKRELREELDVSIETVRLFERVLHEYPDLTVYLSVYEARIVSGEPKMLEHNDIKWILPREIDDYDFCPADEAILRKIKKEF